MKKLILASVSIAFSLFAQEPLSNEERLGIENANLRIQIIRSQEAETRKKANDIFEAACKRVGFPIGECKLDPVKNVLVRESKPKPQEKK